MVTLRKICYKFYEPMRDIIVPGLRNSQFAYREVLKSYVNQDTRWLDLGCGHQILPEWMPAAEQDQAALMDDCKLMVGIDAELSSLQKHRTIKYKMCGDMKKLPIKDNFFNLLTANMVVEHIKNPAETLSEVYRVLAPGGHFILHTPNFLNYQILLACITPKWLRKKLIEFLEDRKENDIFPTYYKMNTYKTIRKLSETRGFDLLDVRMVNSSPKTVMLGPAVIGELLLIRLFELKWFENLRTDIIVVLQKKPF